MRRHGGLLHLCGISLNTKKALISEANRLNATSSPLGIRGWVANLLTQPWRLKEQMCWMKFPPTETLLQAAALRDLLWFRGLDFLDTVEWSYLETGIAELGGGRHVDSERSQ